MSFVPEGSQLEQFLDFYLKITNVNHFPIMVQLAMRQVPRRVVELFTQV